MAVKKHHQRTIDKLHVLIRMELANPLMNATDIATLIGLSIQRYSVLKASNLYKQIHNAYMTGVLSSLDTKVNGNLGLTGETLNFAVPIAMQKLVAQMIQDKDLRVQNKACNDLLDRHGRFAKVTRVGLPTDEQGRGVAEDKDNKAVAEMMRALENGSTQVPTTPNIGSSPLTESTQ